MKLLDKYMNVCDTLDEVMPGWWYKAPLAMMIILGYSSVCNIEKKVNELLSRPIIH